MEEEYLDTLNELKVRVDHRNRQIKELDQKILKINTLLDDLKTIFLHELSLSKPTHTLQNNQTLHQLFRQISDLEKEAEAAQN